MIALVGTVLATSLVGSPHCAAMCGGRLLSYLALGAIAGGLGAGLDRLGAAAGLARVAAVASGSLMIVWGGVALLRAIGAPVPEPAAPGFAHRAMARALRAVHAQPPVARALVVGLVTTLLPCGFLYAYVAVAAGAGSPLAGALAMAAFWAGTVPVMAGLGLAAGRALGPLSRRLPVVTAAGLIVIGLFTVAGKFHDTRGHAAHAGHGMQHVAR